MAFTRTTTINAAPGGDSTKQAVLDLDTDLTGAFGHLNTLDATKAPIAKGVTNGDSHDHSGGDGAQIAYSGLSGLPTLGSMAAQNTGTYAGPGSSQAFTVGAFTQTGNALLAQTTGNLLIGTTTDDGVNKLRVNGRGYFAGKLTVYNSIIVVGPAAGSDAVSLGPYLGATSDTNAYKGFWLQQNASNGLDIWLGNASATGWIKSATISSTGLSVNGTISASALPTADPHVAGAFWRSGNTVMVSTG